MSYGRNRYLRISFYSHFSRNLPRSDRPLNTKRVAIASYARANQFERV
jgi:hypothetical protein